jgi:hypothetical protein
MVEASCRYFQKGFTDSVTEDASIAVIGVCTHPRLQRDNPDCENCVIPSKTRYQMCPGIAQKFDQVRQQFRYRCTIHRVKVADPFSQCKSLRACPLDCEELAS